eukprot:TRINITY_DN11410_c0_g1_i1.p5 TRINITY_DN11410_c0_g1~~TRINITY_DN11410_c0_g1_i1.p5  ORF type:complete len:223 (+),score=-5.18 TRINITY_DN11410_c0_g1_i1:666-1334(+)
MQHLINNKVNFLCVDVVQIKCGIQEPYHGPPQCLYTLHFIFQFAIKIFQPVLLKLDSDVVILKQCKKYLLVYQNICIQTLLQIVLLLLSFIKKKKNHKQFCRYGYIFVSNISGFVFSHFCMVWILRNVFQTINIIMRNQNNLLFARIVLVNMRNFLIFGVPKLLFFWQVYYYHSFFLQIIAQQIVGFINSTNIAQFGGLLLAKILLQPMSVVHFPKFIRNQS